MTAKVETQKILVKADRSLVLTERIPIVEGNVAVDQVEFTFEEPADWRDLSIFAYFTNSASETTEHVNLGTLGSATKKTASIPASVTQDVGFIGVALQGAIITGTGDEATVQQRATTQENNTILKVYKSGVVVYNPDPESPIAPSILEEVEQRLAEAIAATEEANQSISQHNDPFVGATDEAAGDKGLVPAPAAGETEAVLTGDGEWTDVHDLIPDKADIDGYYELLTAGAADNLTGRGDGVSASYLYRTAGGTEDIADGVATIKAIYGETVGWNQLARTVTTSDTINGVTYTPDGNGGVLASGTVVDSPSKKQIAYSFECIKNHKYLQKACPRGGSRTTYCTTITQYAITGNPVDIGEGAMFVAQETGFVGVVVMIDVGTTINNLTFYPQVFDLTAIFGAGNEPATVEEFEALYPLPYYPYDAGTLKPVNMTGVETVGFNQWDDSVTLDSGKAWKAANGKKGTAEGYFCSSDQFEVFPNTEYTASFTSTAGAVYSACFYDADHVFIGSVSCTRTSNGNRRIGTFTTPANCRYVGINFGGSPVNPTDPCLHLKWSGYRDGEYESYWKSQRTIDVAQYFPTGLKRAGSVRDALYEDHADTVVGSVDLGTLSWGKNASNGYFVASGLSINLAVCPDGVVPNIKCARYQASTQYYVSSATAYKDKRITTYGGNQIRIRDTAYETATDLKASLSGVILYYELATPTTVEIDPPLNMQLKVSDFGTERVMVPDGEISAPPTMQVVYGLNAVDTIRRLPTQYISDDSFENFCQAMETHFNLETTETWDETNNCYTYQLAHDASAEITKADIYKAMFSD